MTANSNRRPSRGSRVISHPETGFTTHVQSNFQDLTGLVVNGNRIVGPSRRERGRMYYDVICQCGRRYETLKQNAGRPGGCRKCSHKGERPYRRLRPYEAQYNNFKGRANHPVHLSYEEYAAIAINEPPCHYCAAELRWSEWRGQYQDAQSGSNLDRKDCRVGYTADNVVPCCGRCNYAKGTHFTYAEWVEIGKLIKSWRVDTSYCVTPQSGRALALLQLEIEGDQ